MKVSVKLRHLRIAPRKVRLIADLVRGKNVQEAQAILNFSVKKPSLPVLKLLNSAIASARNNFGLDENNLYISKITVDEGPKLKRWRARSRGQAFEIQKKTSHINLVISEIKEEEKEKRDERKKKIKEELKRKTKKEEQQKSAEDETKEKEEIKRPEVKPREEIKKPGIAKRAKKIFRRKSF